jgi:hypothetical protein
MAENKLRSLKKTEANVPAVDVTSTGQCPTLHSRYRNANHKDDVRNSRRQLSGASILL